MFSPSLAAGSLVRRARQAARMSQVELAARAGVTQSVVSAYESGRRQPSLPMLTALIEATGHDLEFSIRPQPGRLAKMSGPVGDRVRHHRKELKAAAAAHGAQNLRVFGSVARGEDGPDSDLDLLVDLPPSAGLFALGRIRSELERIVETHVDLIPAQDLKPEIRARIAGELVPL